MKGPMERMMEGGTIDVLHNTVWAKVWFRNYNKTTYAEVRDRKDGNILATFQAEGKRDAKRLYNRLCNFYFGITAVALIFNILL